MGNNVKNESCELNEVREMYSLDHEYNNFYLAYCKYKEESVHQYYCACKLGNLSFSEGLLQVLNSISISNENAPHTAVISPNVTLNLLHEIGAPVFSFLGRSFGFDKYPMGFTANYYDDNILGRIRSNQEFDIGTIIKLFDNCRRKYYQGRNVFDALVEDFL